MIRYEKAKPEDAPILAEVSKRAFHSDVNCGGSGEGGPQAMTQPSGRLK